MSDEEVVAAFAAAVDEWKREQAEAELREVVRFLQKCQKCMSWVNRGMIADVIAVCPYGDSCQQNTSRRGE